MTDTLWATLLTMAADDLSPFWDRQRRDGQAALVAAVALVDRLRADLDAVTAELRLARTDAHNAARERDNLRAALEAADRLYAGNQTELRLQLNAVTAERDQLARLVAEQTRQEE